MPLDILHQFGSISNCRHISIRERRKIKTQLNKSRDAGDSKPVPFFARYSAPIIGRKEELKMKEFLANIVKVFITLAILGPVIALVGIGLGLGALLF